jgi:RNA polymerase sigma-70 factor (ECF subfamily)
MDEARFESIYRRNAAPLWSFLNRLAGDAAVADDLLQKTFVRMLRAEPRIESDEHVRRWLFRTATNVAMDHFRQSRRERARDERLLQSPPSIAAQDEMRQDMMRTFAELNPRERALLWLAHVEGEDHQHIASALGVKANSVKVLLFRARKRLAELLTRRGLAPEVGR